MAHKTTSIRPLRAASGRAREHVPRLVIWGRAGRDAGKCRRLRYPSSSGLTFRLQPPTVDFSI